MSRGKIEIDATSEVKAYENALEGMLWELCDKLAGAILRITRDTAHSCPQRDRLAEKLYDATREVI